MSLIDHLYCSDVAAGFGLPPSDWEVAIDKRKAPIGGDRMVVVGVKHLPTGRKLTDSVAGRLSKRDLNDHAVKLVKALSERLGYRPDNKQRKKNNR